MCKPVCPCFEAGMGGLTCALGKVSGVLRSFGLHSLSPASSLLLLLQRGSSRSDFEGEGEMLMRI